MSNIPSPQTARPGVIVRLLSLTVALFVVWSAAIAFATRAVLIWS